MKIVHLTYSKDRGGASKACLRMHRALRKQGVDSHIITCLPFSESEECISSFCNTPVKNAFRKIKKVLNLAKVMYFQKTNNKDLHTYDTTSVISAKFINNLDADIVHFHWVNYSMFSIKIIGEIQKPIVWTFHDMWPFMGCEHYDDIHSPERYVDGYLKSNKNVRGVDFNRLAWEQKKKFWKNQNFNIVCLSNWMKNCVKRSYLLKNQNVSLIPNVIEEDKFYPIDKTGARKTLKLPHNKKLVMFGAFHTHNINKGGDLLFEALKCLKIEDVELVVFGSDSGENIHGITTRYMGYIKDEKVLNQLYNAADVVVVPSRQDNLPNIVLESIKTGTPVAGFNIGGLPDMIIHKYNGYLAEPFNTKELADGIEFILRNSDETNFKENCINHFNKRFSENVVVPQLVELYKKSTLSKL